MLKILIADDHAIVRRGIKDILKHGFPSAEIVEVGDAEALVEKVFREEWQVVISDVSMPGRSGLDALQQIKVFRPSLPVLILSNYPEDHYATRVLRAGASGYLTKDTAPDELVNAVHRVLSGRKYITDTVAELLASSFDTNSTEQAHQNLSDREFEVMKLLAAGKSVTEISEAFYLNVTTISTYRSRILTKMNLKTNADLTQYAIENGLI